MENCLGCYKIDLNKLSKCRQPFLYECVNTDTNKLCCAKILNKRDQSDNINCCSFDQEQKVLEQIKWIRHDNILTIYDYKEEEDYIYKFCDIYDETLFEYMKQKVAITKLELFDFISQISSGYLELKQLNIIHRDLKPENIVIKKNHNQTKYKIGDFRMSRIIDDSNSQQTKFKEIQKYSSPEILLNDMKYSYESDIFSFGLILYEMIGGNVDVIENQIKKKEFFEAVKLQGFKKYFKENQAQNILQEEILAILDNIIVYDPSKRITWENLNSLVTKKIIEYNSYSQPISERGQVNFNQNKSIGDIQNNGKMVENFNFQNLSSLKFTKNKINNQFQNKQDNNQIINNQNIQQNSFRQHLRTESDVQFVEQQYNTQRQLGKIQQSVDFSKDFVQQINNGQFIRINFNTMK